MITAMTERQTAPDVLMIRPVRFSGNVQTAASNRFQQLDAREQVDEVQAAALREFNSLVDALGDAGVNVHVVDDTPEPHTPDSIFPNNWVSFHADGTVVLYPMLAPNRRLERRLDVIEWLDRERGFNVTRTIDLAHREAEEKFLEGTGSLVLDRVNRVAYACLSPRTDMDVLGEFSQRLDYDVVAFDAFDESGAPIYHTNVVMSVGSGFAAICSEAVEPARRNAVTDVLRASGRALVDLSMKQMQQFAGNMLELQTRDGGAIIAMSETARNSLDTDQVETLTARGERIVSVAIPTIERLGGGSVRCMIAEVHATRRK